MQPILIGMQKKNLWKIIMVEFIYFNNLSMKNIFKNFGKSKKLIYLARNYNNSAYKLVRTARKLSFFMPCLICLFSQVISLFKISLCLNYKIIIKILKNDKL